jgi:uncharacterized membrane protein YdjX (TVP38/TMEM64 family)
VRRLALGLIVVLLILVSAAFAHEYWAEFQLEAIRARFAGNPWTPLIFILVHIVVSLSFIPRTVLSVAAGALFGLWIGTLLNLVAAMAGGIIGFMLVRYLHRGVFALDGPQGLAWVAAIKRRLDDGGWLGVAQVRLVPIVPHSAGNYAFGLTDVSLRDYSIGTLIGLLPTTVFGVAIGASGAAATSGSGGWIASTLIGLGALALSLALPRLIARLRRVPKP